MHKEILKSEPNLAGRLLIVVSIVLAMVLPVMYFDYTGHVPDDAFFTAYLFTFCAYGALWLSNVVVRATGCIVLILGWIVYELSYWIVTGKGSNFDLDKVTASWWYAWPKFWKAFGYGYLYLFGDYILPINYRGLRKCRWVL